MCRATEKCIENCFKNMEISLTSKGSDKDKLRRVMRAIERAEL
jgi:hypothetical protein